MKYKKVLMITIVIILCVGLGAVMWIYGFTVVSTEEGKQVIGSGAFDPEAYVDEIWESKIIPTIIEEAVELSTILKEIKTDNNGFVKKDDLIPITEKYGLITVGEAHVYMVKGQGKVINVDTKSNTGIIEISLDGYTGPIKIKMYIGPRIPSDESSVRDSVGFINFGDFREQTEYGKVGAEINKRCMNNINLPDDKNELLGKTISFYGAFSIRTFNIVNIKLDEIKITPVQIDIMEA
jgi:predicted lipoprotein